MEATLVRELCPNDGAVMNLESRKRLEFMGGRDEEVLRYHCGTCRKFFNIPTRERQ